MAIHSATSCDSRCNCRTARAARRRYVKRCARITAPISNAYGALPHSWTALYPGFGVWSALHVQRRCSVHEPKERKELTAPGEVNHSQPFIFLDATHDSGGSVRMETSTTDSSLIIFWEMSKLNQFSSFHGNVLPSLQTPDNLVQSAAGDG
ncbi:hypothetical protein GPC19245_43510 (plasmid) [Enterobacter asburiae]|nr:hypothetical protein EAS1808013_p10980 [Enterobacter asburiae]